MNAAEAVEFVVRKDALATAQVRTVPFAPLAEGQVRLAIERFAFTSNNVSYATSGDSLGYWGFYPAAEGWGIVPVWGFATVAESAQGDFAPGRKVWGFFPMSSHVVLAPARASRHGFVDGAVHRQALPEIYNQYVWCDSDLWHSAGDDDIEALLRPLFATSWLVDDFLVDQAFFGARVLLLSSASSKTACGTAFQLAKRANVEVVGLTSERNRRYCESLRTYHRVLTYDEIDSIDRDAACVYVDFAGDANVRAAVHGRFQELRYDCSIGATHTGDFGSSKGLPGPRPIFFFAPSQVKKRIGEWGYATLMQRMIGDWDTFRRRVLAPPDPWLEVYHHTGPDAVQKLYATILEGRGDPRIGHILSLRNG